MQNKIQYLIQLRESLTIVDCRLRLGNNNKHCLKLFVDWLNRTLYKFYTENELTINQNNLTQKTPYCNGHGFWAGKGRSLVTKGGGVDPKGYGNLYLHK